LRTLIATARQQEEAEEEEGILKKKKEQFAPRVLKKVTVSSTPEIWNEGPNLNSCD
jgi:hypothetical protein